MREAVCCEGKFALKSFEDGVCMGLDLALLRYSEEIGIDMIGVTKPARLDLHFQTVKQSFELLKAFTSGENLESRLNPSLGFQNIKSILVVAVSHNFAEKQAARGLEFSLVKTARGSDYHRSLKEKLAKLEGWLCDHGSTECVAQVDTGPLVERELAVQAGLGFLGKNMSLLTREFSSFVNLGYIACDLDLASSAPFSENLCGGCELCVKACPTSALRGDFTMDHEKCLSFMSQNKKRKLDKTCLLIKSIYGCDICQNVCPYSKNAKLLKNDDETEYFVWELLHMSNKAFKAKYWNKSFAWLPKRVLQENLLFSLLNSEDAISKSMLEQLKTEKREIFAEIFALQSR